MTVETFSSVESVGGLLGFVTGNPDKLHNVQDRLKFIAFLQNLSLGIDYVEHGRLADIVDFLYSGGEARCPSFGRREALAVVFRCDAIDLEHSAFDELRGLDVGVEAGLGQFGVGVARHHEHQQRCELCGVGDEFGFGALAVSDVKGRRHHPFLGIMQHGCLFLVIFPGVFVEFLALEDSVDEMSVKLLALELGCVGVDVVFSQTGYEKHVVGLFRDSAEEFVNRFEDHVSRSVRHE